MPEIKLENVTKRWGKFYGVDDLTLTIKNNAFVTLLGPSGCGKTTTLRMIAGLETPTSGKITIGDTVVFDSSRGINVPSNKRKVGFLFQNYALWPNMTVYQNIAFGLSNIKEEMNQYAFELKEAAVILQALENPAQALEILEDSKTKEGKVDEKKALIRLTETFELPMSGAKKLYASLSSSDINTEKGKWKAAIEKEKEKLASSGCSAADDFSVIKDGKPVRSVRKLTKDEIDVSVRKVSKLVKIGMFMDRYPAELSGGQQQRVAIARTLAPQPSVLFMDEPLSNLDAKLRLEMRYELQRLHVETGSTFVYVTHDQMEFAADFVGNPSINFIEASGQQNEDGSISLELFKSRKARFIPHEKLSLSQWRTARDKDVQEKEEEMKKASSQKGYVEKSNKEEVFRYHIQKVVETDDSLEGAKKVSDNDFVLGLRPELLEMDENGPLECEIYGAMPTGMESTIKVSIDDFLLTSVIFGNLNFKLGTRIRMKMSSERIMLFDRSSGRLITLGHLEF